MYVVLNVPMIKCISELLLVSLVHIKYFFIIIINFIIIIIIIIIIRHCGGVKLGLFN